MAVQPTRAIRLSYQPGRVFPLYAGASGKVLLPWLSAQLVDTALAQAEGQLLATGRKLTSAALLHEVERIRDLGYCVTHSELDAGVSAVAAPVFGRGGQIFAAISVAGPETGFNADQLPALIDQVCAAAAQTGRSLSLRAGEERG